MKVKKFVVKAKRGDEVGSMLKDMLEELTDQTNEFMSGETIRAEEIKDTFCVIRRIKYWCAG